MMELMKTKLLLSDGGGSKSGILLLYMMPVITKFIESFFEKFKIKLEATMENFMKFLFSYKIVSSKPEWYTYKMDLNSGYNISILVEMEKFINKEMDTRDIPPMVYCYVERTNGKYCKGEQVTNGKKLLEETWIPVKCEDNKVEIKRTREKNPVILYDSRGEEKKNDELDILYIRSRERKQLVKFLDYFIKIYQEKYDKLNKADVDQKRTLYFYNMRERNEKRFSYNAGRDDNRIFFTRYMLKNTKCFEALFIPNKVKFMNQIKNFKNNTGIYSKKGVSKKLGYLLYGPPGSGKTTFIKTLANEMNRDVVSISLAGIDNNDELSNLIFHASKDYSNYSDPTKENYSFTTYFSQTIFIFEDIDCMGREKDNILMNRENIKRNKHRMEKEKDKKKKKKKKKSSSSEEEESSDSDNEVNISFAWTKKRTLDLSGILNVLDGVIDTPERVVIMTTNHIEKLDPALIRPGRIDHVIHLGYIKTSEALEMIKYYSDFTEIDKYYDQLNEIFTNNDITPAFLEKECILNEGNIDEIIKNLTLQYKKEVEFENVP